MPVTCVIFDVDGTLVDSNAFDDELYGRALLDVLGPVRIRAAWSDYEHKTDCGILRQVCRENGIDPRTVDAAVRHRFGQLVSAYLETGGLCPPIPGGPGLFESLRNRAGLHVGIATGGWTHTALMKLRFAGYDTSDLAIASADDAFARTEILEIARARLPPTDAALYVGDGEWDQRACEALGWTFIGVGAPLRGRCAHWTADLRPGEVIDRLLGAGHHE